MDPDWKDLKIQDICAIAFLNIVAVILGVTIGIF